MQTSSPCISNTHIYITPPFKTGFITLTVKSLLPEELNEEGKPKHKSGDNCRV